LYYTSEKAEVMRKRKRRKIHGSQVKESKRKEKKIPFRKK